MSPNARPKNVFIVHRGAILTPAASAGALLGITRGAILDNRGRAWPARAGSQLTRYDIWCADECFLSGTGAEVIPVVKLDGPGDRPGKTGSHHP